MFRPRVPLGGLYVARANERRIVEFSFRLGQRRDFGATISSGRTRADVVGDREFRAWVCDMRRGGFASTGRTGNIALICARAKLRVAPSRRQSRESEREKSERGEDKPTTA